MLDDRTLNSKQLGINRESPGSRKKKKSQEKLQNLTRNSTKIFRWQSVYSNTEKHPGSQAQKQLLEARSNSSCKSKGKLNSQSNPRQVNYLPKTKISNSEENINRIQSLRLIYIIQNSTKKYMIHQEDNVTPTQEKKGAYDWMSELIHRAQSPLSGYTLALWVPRIPYGASSCTHTNSSC